MPKPLAIAVIETPASGLSAALSDIAGQDRVSTFQDLLGEADKIVLARPDVLFVEAALPRGPAANPGLVQGEFLGAVRMLMATQGNLRLVLTGPEEQEVALQHLADQLGAAVLRTPSPPADLAALLDRLAGAAGRADPAMVRALTRGLADAIHNPLLAVSGHLQLLAQGFHPTRDAHRRDQVESAIGGAQRIAAAVDRIRLLSRVAVDPRGVGEKVDPVAILGRLNRDSKAPLSLSIPSIWEPGAFPGDPEAVGSALEELLNVGEALRDTGHGVSLDVIRDTRGQSIRMHVQPSSNPSSGLQQWQLPRTYEPYFLNRVLKGSPHGLALFLIQSVVHSHGGSAIARRSPDGGIRIELLWRDPMAGPDQPSAAS